MKNVIIYQGRAKEGSHFQILVFNGLKMIKWCKPKEAMKGFINRLWSGILLDDLES